MEGYTWTASNYKMMAGKWRVGILLEMGYRASSAIENENELESLTGNLYFCNRNQPYPISQPLSAEEIGCLCNGLKMVSRQMSTRLKGQPYPYMVIALRSIQFSDCTIQNEAFTAAAIQWASEAFRFPMPDVKAAFDAEKGEHGVYLFDFPPI